LFSSRAPILWENPQNSFKRGSLLAPNPFLWAHNFYPTGVPNWAKKYEEIPEIEGKWGHPNFKYRPELPGKSAYQL